MWERTKRLINSYLDDMINRASGPDKDVRAITRAEMARLNELEVQTRASIKMFEKELAEVELKIIGVAERERMARDQGNESAATNAVNQLVTLSNHRDLLKKQISEANSSAARAASLREERRRMGEELAAETHLTSMRENIAGIQSPFDPMDPASTLDEMRARLNRSAISSADAEIAAADHELETQRARAAADELLARYKQGIGGSEAQSNATVPQPSSGNLVSPPDDPEADSPKTLGRTEGPIRPID